jgi:uncharacterized membrane protein YozB (DUF420 family)
VSGKELLAAINASLNGLSATLLVLAFIFIKRRMVAAHAWTMIAALFTSAVFLACYLTSYFKYSERSTKEMAHIGSLRYFYLALLASHVLLAVVMLPMIVMSLVRAYQRKWQKHHKIASPTFFIWFYVSVTGVVVYLLLYQLFPRM